MLINIYLDTNILRSLQNESQYKDLYNKIVQSKEEYFYLYSFAHILDLKRDKTEQKFVDLKFMETLVDRNYLIHYYGQENIELSDEYPIDAFNNHVEEPEVPSISIEYLLKQFDDKDDDDLNTKSINNIMRNLLAMLNDLPAFNVSDIKLDTLLPEQRELFEKMIPTKKEIVTYGDIMNQSSHFFDELYNSKDTYKALRRYLVASLNLNDRLDYRNENFNEEFHESLFKQTFTDYVYQTLDPTNTNREITWETFMIQAYSLMNILGVDKEPNRKARFPNTFNDAQHSYYASVCHYVVSSDEGFLRKCKLLYKLVDVKSVVLSLEEFIGKFDSLGKDHTK